jgi:hypothetical protein
VHRCCSYCSTTAESSRDGLASARCCNYSYCAPDDGWSYHPKHVERPVYRKVMNCIQLHLVGQLLTLFAECLVLLITVVSVCTQQQQWIAVANRLASLCLETHCPFSSAESCYKASSNANSSMKVLRLEESASPSSRGQNFLNPKYRTVGAIL